MASDRISIPALRERTQTPPSLVTLARPELKALVEAVEAAAQERMLGDHASYTRLGLALARFEFGEET